MGMKSSHGIGIAEPVTPYIVDEEPGENEILTWKKKSNPISETVEYVITKPYNKIALYKLLSKLYLLLNKGVKRKYWLLYHTTLRGHPWV